MSFPGVLMLMFGYGSVVTGYCGTNLNGFPAAKVRRGDVELRVVHLDGAEGPQGACPW